MSIIIDYKSGMADEEIILAHLLRCDHSFIPSLSSRIDIKNYAKKIHQMAKNFEAWESGDLIGLVSIYCNTPNRVGAFITNVSVLPGWQGLGVATRLLKNCVAHSRALGFERVELEVDIHNTNALQLYIKLGFMAKDDSASSQRMAFSLKG